VNRLLAVHGIATGADAPVASQWRQTLAAAHAIQVPVEECRWPSTGSAAGDCAALALSPEFRMEALESVVHGLADFAEEGHGVVLAHSMGTVLAVQAERMLRTGLPMVLMASPLSNPALHLALDGMGLARPPSRRLVHIWNNDDPIPGARSAVQPEYFEAVRIAVADNELGEISFEHDVRLYLRHVHTLTALETAWGTQ